MTVIQDEKERGGLVVRLRRIEGQLRGIQAMIESGADCEKVVQQISASRRALDKAFFAVLACAIQAEGQDAPRAGRGAADTRVKQAAELLAKYG